MIKSEWLSILDIEHIENFCKVFNVPFSRIEEIYVNPGRSANNENVVIVADGRPVLYRIPGKGTEKFCNREREKKAYELLAPLKITDEALFISPDNGIKMSKYYEHSRIPDSKNMDELKASMETLRKLHELTIDFGYTDTLFQRMARYKTFAHDVGGERFFLEGINQYFDKMDQFRHEMESNEDVQHVFIHGDASINNFLITKEFDYPILIDFEFPAMGDPYDDLATFCVDAEYRKKDILQVLELYLGKKPNKSQQYKLLGFCVVGALMWYCWAAYKAAIETDNQLYIDFRNSYHQYVIDVSFEMMQIGDLETTDEISKRVHR